MSMERNYDELFAEMLMQIDRHTEELNKSSQEMTKQSRLLDMHTESLEKHAHEFIAIRSEQNQMREAILNRLEGMEKISGQHLEMLVQSASILDRIRR